jgi:hypothetical protein
MASKDPSSRRSTPRRKPQPATTPEPRTRKTARRVNPAGFDSDFGVALAVVPALRRRPDA